MTDMTPDSSAHDAPPAETGDDMAAAIDELMAGPVRSLPKVVVVGDDAVSGFNPAPQLLPSGS